MSQIQPIPQCSPLANYLHYKDEIDAAINRVLLKGRYIIGDEVASFESEFASFIGTSFSVGVASGTDAIELALRSLGVGNGDTVITVSHTAVATVSAIRRCGGTPAFVDIDPDTFTMDTESLYTLIPLLPEKPKAIIPVHLYGYPADMMRILKISAEFEIPVVEDCAQAHGALINGQAVGTFGALAAFSFYPTKNLSALGDGGIVTTNSRDHYERLKALRQYGWKKRYISDKEGVSSRLDEIQAAVLRVKLKHLEEDNLARQEHANKYLNGLSTKGLKLPVSSVNVTHAYHQFVISSVNRDYIMNSLSEKMIGTLIHYPTPVHLQPAYSSIPLLIPLPVTESVCKQILSLPMYAELSDGQIAQIISSLNTITH